MLSITSFIPAETLSNEPVNHEHTDKKSKTRKVFLSALKERLRFQADQNTGTGIISRDFRTTAEGQPNNNETRARQFISREPAPALFVWNSKMIADTTDSPVGPSKDSAKEEKTATVTESESQTSDAASTNSIPDQEVSVASETSEVMEAGDLISAVGVNGTGKTDVWRAESIALLALSKVRGLGFQNMRALAALDTSLYEMVRTNDKEQFWGYLRQAKCRLSFEHVDRWFESRRELLMAAREQFVVLKKQGISLLHAKQDCFPKRLLDAQGPPQWLFVRGDLGVFERPMLGVVGTRKPTEDGLFLARYIGAALPAISGQIATVSGLAVGIDQIVHRESIRSKVPTVAVLGTGILADYPSGTAGLKKEICDGGGAIVTEYFPNESYAKENFVLRNRLQAALCKALIPVEWAVQSGTAHTVRFSGGMKRSIVCLRMPQWQDDAHPEFAAAIELGGKVFTVPGEENRLFEHLGHVLVNDDSREQTAHQLKLFT